MITAQAFPVLMHLRLYDAHSKCDFDFGVGINNEVFGGHSEGEYLRREAQGRQESFGPGKICENHKAVKS